MTKKTRTVLSLFFLFLFLAIGPSIILYSQGYRLDFKERRIVQTGGLFLKVLPKQAEVYLDGKMAKKTDFFFGSCLIENLLPKKYKVEVRKEGYFPWKKELEITEKEVTEAKNIILFPENQSWTILTKDVRDFWFSPDQKKIIIKEEKDDGWALKLFELDKEIKSHLLEKKDISSKQKEVDLLGLNFSEDSKKIFLEAGVGEELKYFTLQLDKFPPLLTETKAPLLLAQNAIVEQKFNALVYYLDELGNFYKNNEKISSKPFPVKPETEYNLMLFQNYIFLKENQTLYQFSQDSRTFEKFFENVQGLKISPDNKKLVYFSNSEIWLLFSEEKMFLLRLSEKIKDVFWLNSDYLIFNTDKALKISEIDNRDRLNIIDIGGSIALSPDSKLFFNPSSKKLYVLSNSELYQTEKILPQ